MNGHPIAAVASAGAAVTATGFVVTAGAVVGIDTDEHPSGDGPGGRGG